MRKNLQISSWLRVLRPMILVTILCLMLSVAVAQTTVPEEPTLTEETFLTPETSAVVETEPTAAATDEAAPIPVTPIVVVVPPPVVEDPATGSVEDQLEETQEELEETEEENGAYEVFTRWAFALFTGLSAALLAAIAYIRQLRADKSKMRIGESVYDASPKFLQDAVNHVRDAFLEGYKLANSLSNGVPIDQEVEPQTAQRTSLAPRPGEDVGPADG